MPALELGPARREERIAIAGLLTAAGLPVEDLDAAMLEAFVVATKGRDLAGVAGLEVYGSNALLRSLAVAAQHRSRGLGARLVDTIEAQARAFDSTASEWRQRSWRSCPTMRTPET